MAVSPNTILYLLKSPIELDNLNQLTFASKQAQENYFLSLPKIEVDRITYQRKDSIIRFPAHIDSIIEYNYCMYQNSNYTNKWFYAFIEHMEYVSDTCTLITIKTDVYQTWMFDINIKRSFVVREHTNNDTVGNNTVYEGFEKGPMINTGFIPITYLRDTILGGVDSPMNSVIVLGATRDLSSTSFPPLYGENYDGLYSGVSYFAFMNSTSVDIVLRLLNEGSGASIDDVVSIFMAPKSLVLADHAFDSYTTTYGDVYVHKIEPSDTSYLEYHSTNTINKPTSLDGYTPINKKLLTGEFNSLNVTNYVGDVQNYRYEFFNGTTCNFNMRGAIKPQCSIQLYPTNYLKANSDESYKSGVYAIQAPPLPICNWNSDQYTAWLASTTNTRTLKAVTGVVSTVAGVAMLATGAGTVAGAGMIAAGIGSIANLSAENADHQKDANANHGSLNAADVNYAGSKVFGAYQTCIKYEYARKLDTVFSAIGYKVNEMKIPNITGRLNWNYVQTQSVNIVGAVPQEDLQEIKDMFNNGVTFWHNPATFLDYSQSNGII